MVTCTTVDLFEVRHASTGKSRGFYERIGDARHAVATSGASGDTVAAVACVYLAGVCYPLKDGFPISHVVRHDRVAARKRALAKLTAEDLEALDIDDGSGLLAGDPDHG
jgi:hypothetical protein